MPESIQVIGYEMETGVVVRYFAMDILAAGRLYRFYCRPSVMATDMDSSCMPINGALTMQEMECAARRLYHMDHAGSA